MWLHATVVLLLYLSINEAFHRDILSLYLFQSRGDGTYYGRTNEGLCSYNPPGLPPVGKSPLLRGTVAINAPQSYGSLSCGMCFKVYGSGFGLGDNPIAGIFYVLVTDLCPECKPGSLDFAEDGDGRWAIQIQAVQCPVGSTKLEYMFQGSHQWYIKLQIRNHRIPITKVRVFQWKKRMLSSLSHTSDGFWVVDRHQQWDQPIKVPLYIEMTAANGAILYDTIPQIVNDVVIPGKAQVPFDPRLPNVSGRNLARRRQQQQSQRRKQQPHQPQQRHNGE